MTNRIADISQRKAARVAGFGYLIIIILGIFAEFFVRSKLIVPGDAATTANNIMASESLFRIGFASDLIMLTCDVVGGSGTLCFTQTSKQESRVACGVV